MTATVLSNAALEKKKSLTEGRSARDLIQAAPSKKSLASAFSPAFPVRLRTVLFRQWIVVISGFLSKTLLKTLRSHFLAFCVLVDLLVHPSAWIDPVFELDELSCDCESCIL